MALTLKPGLLIVLEGLDGTGKTTQLERICEAALRPDSPVFTPATVPLFTHQPSGAGAVGAGVYRITEEAEALDPLSRQLLHFAAHSEHYATEILPALQHRSVIMDRCWWSAIAYGYFGHRLSDHMSYEVYEFLAQLPARGRLPDLVFLFDEQHEVDHRHDNEAVRAGYHFLRERFADTCFVLKGTVVNTTISIFQVLSQLGWLIPESEPALP